MFHLYAIEDLKSGFSNPFVAVNNDIAKRDFVRLVRDPSSSLFHNPEDYRLMVIGTYDYDTGIVEGFPAPVHLMDAKGVVVDA